ncbi:hypothetical protein DM02DRAFT_734000 [Periconia macrospinosa]|uniref:Helicase ATP-binding domain-containing protein n=1 Tax=Periconia macrospinosa TaxID=97972 RepID=A0A2V1D1E8_9PLEO|nr:hypothetical protein DM02DRAFT_734000 [Periconia macrospinosa]
MDDRLRDLPPKEHETLIEVLEKHGQLKYNNACMGFLIDRGFYNKKSMKHLQGMHEAIIKGMKWVEEDAKKVDNAELVKKMNTMRAQLENEVEQELAPAKSHARALQSGHSLETEEGNYGRCLMESPFQTMAEREEFRRVSMDWHRVLEFASAWEDGRMHPGVRAEMVAQQEKQALQRWSSLATVDLKAEFRRLAGRPDAEYRGKQEESLRAVVQRRLRVLVVMATGTGKSMLFMLPASVSPDGVTVVVAPLNALRDDLQDRCDQLGIPCAKWDGRRPPYWARIVLVTPESAVTKGFSRFLDEKRMLHQLDRIVIDECHVLLESTKDWRPDVLKMTEMTEKGTQVVYLTATLPPTLQPAFFQTAGLDAETVTVCRDERTTRTNIAYQVLEYPRGTLEKVLVELVAAKRRRYGPEAQIIVYCPTVEETKRLARLLQCSAYYREMGSDEEKARMHMDGRLDRQRCEVGESKCDLCEQHPGGTKRPAVEEEQEEPEETQASIAAVAAEEQRKELERAMAVEERRVEIQQRRRTEQMVYELERLEQHLERWSHACAICMAVQANPARHRWEECPKATEVQLKQMQAKVMSMHRVKWERYARCLYCWAPQAICNKWEETSTQGAFKTRGMHVPCQYEGVLQRAVAALLAFQQSTCTPWLEQQMQDAAIVHGSDDVRLYKWLGLKIKMCQRDANQMCRLLYAWEEGHVHSHVAD